MVKKRDTVTYELKDGNRVVYVGTTNDPDRREQEHKDQGKKFGHMNVTSRKMTDDGAKKKESEKLATYRKNQGKNPKYNKDSDG
ncbi:MAG: GIY-YIG nuclease family protein [Candidatus Marinimicrobia bacterium]|nr:GIY-YIG nuclease family protein [Candidatus Neomarinimicrobiota bacterium]